MCGSVIEIYGDLEEKAGSNCLLLSSFSRASDVGSLGRVLEFYRPVQLTDTTPGLWEQSNYIDRQVFPLYAHS